MPKSSLSSSLSPAVSTSPMPSRFVSMFGSLKNAINADPEQVGVISGWGREEGQGVV